ncbi:MAG: NUDIX domain-containing protein [Gemmatimonadetes bacterium]|nr:NUDIX domain-containing protein [Gemmatimonadota bacterium]
MSGARVRHESSAGGVVFRRDGDATYVLLIRDSYRNWGFPKGHIEPGETPGAAAVREVAEETGLTSLELLGEVSTIAWTFTFRGARVRKTCHFFAFASASARARPQRREGITSCRWVRADEGVRMLSYRNARGVLKEALALVGLAPPVAGA